ncbi:peptidoglycan-binding protein [Saccharomonospora saliphila]|uniref:peptidoglycan-binding protein n=1 Tax=Saccharomonospora saliphila TaxID=369829 RepID=UPI0003A278B7|nr:peptidoglycan-binding protein [Saccharomonospora saliphila]
MCDQCAGTGHAGNGRGLRRRTVLAGLGVGALAWGVAGGVRGSGTASAASLKDASWCNPARGYFPDGGHFGAPRGSYSHAGQDITNSVGTAVYAAAAGTVIARGTNVLTGRTGYGIVISHGSGYYTYYGHLNTFRVGSSATVSAGQWIADMGATGNVTGPHLHFETHAGGLGSVLDPVDFMGARGVDLGGGWSTIDPEARGETVKVIQSLITQRGTALVTDGYYGPVSVSAVKDFQSSRGLVADGQVGPVTWPELVYTLTRGADGDHVKAAQTALNKHSAGLLVDGDFGAVTDSAVRDFQSVNRLYVDGVCGPVTWAALVG